jgi:hypothetical protein
MLRPWTMTESGGEVCRSWLRKLVRTYLQILAINRPIFHRRKDREFAEINLLSQCNPVGVSLPSILKRARAVASE